ncbi:hypothetical protein [Bifidobacterium simiarum]|uniref:hypothetical protein n=1 Tax=Bifidobacterium simiarum TaxID=2045441 RepID=UPI001BDC23F3|nr:hypothetical protein [Bifidobacterium simiarum]MBT1165547.1 hypothetical protein [Bifidobacterium simiarum]
MAIMPNMQAIDAPVSNRRRAAGLLAILSILVIILAGVLPTSAHAATDGTAGPVGSLTIAAQIKDSSSTHYLAGDTYAVAHVADATLGSNGTIAKLTTRSAFRSLSRDWASLTSSQFNAAAKELAAYAGQHRLYDVTTKAVTGADGIAIVSDLTPGLYLVSRTGIAAANKAYACDAFLVAVPETDDSATGTAGGANYDVVAAPKFEQVSVPNPPTPNHPGGEPTPNTPGTPGTGTPGTPGSGSTPGTGGQTGTTSSTGPSTVAKTGAAVMRYVEAAVILGALAVIVLFVRDRIRSRESHESLK